MLEKHYNIFYADDDADDRDFFKEVMSDIAAGHRLFTQSSGEELLGVLHSPPPQANLVFLDLNMPQKNGYEVLKEIRNSPAISYMPVIILSTSNDEFAIDQAKKLGASLFLSKPGSYDDLQKMITAVLSKDWENYKPTEKDFYFTIN
jgi:CheY-like chemotaxis protein